MGLFGKKINAIRSSAPKMMLGAVVQVVAIILAFIIPIALCFMVAYGLILFSTAGKKETERLELLVTEIQTEIDAGHYDSAELKLAGLVFKESSKENREVWQKRQELLQKQIDEKRSNTAGKE